MTMPTGDQSIQGLGPEVRLDNSEDFFGQKRAAMESFACRVSRLSSTV